MNIFKKIVIVMLVLIVSLTGCNKSNKTNSKDTSSQKVIYTTVYPVYDFTKKIAGDKFEVELIVKNGQEPHDFEPSSDDVKNLQNANAFIYNGAGLESFADKLIGSLDENVPVLEASKGIELLEGHHHEDEEDEEDEEHEEHEHEHSSHDPHVWLSPKNAEIEMKNIKDFLQEIDPENKSYYEDNFNKNRDELKKLDETYKNSLKDIKDRKIVVSHEAYGYLCNDYNLEQLGIQGVNAETEPDAKTMAKIVEFVNTNNINTIFTEELIDPKVASVIAQETGIKTEVLSPLEGLSDEEIKNNDDYFSIMNKNLEKLIEALK